MAREQFSFDVVSEVDLAEVRNAVEQAKREIQTRFDFKGTGTSLSLDEDLIELRSSTEARLKAAGELVREKLVRRRVPLKALSEGPVLPAARGTFRQSLHVNRGISQDKAREITRLVKDTGLKVQAQVMGDQVRISGKQKDDLQAVIRALREHDFGIPLQFTNYRP
ncbi:MAG TPA: YajQ family cyclic di-GMP-binding protein [Actinomycetota bacterium]|nr:YajQ family cyclic di-GMP-binding protein [Actinomycetota bacterium]